MKRFFYTLLSNPYFFFLPFLVLLIAYTLIQPPDPTGDAERYLKYAQNLIHGYFSPSAPNVVLMNGPGYPIILVPFVYFKLPMLCITILNAFFYYFSIVFLYKSLIEIVSRLHSVIFSAAWALYFIAYQTVPHIATEPFTFFLVSVLIFQIIKAFTIFNKQAARKYMLLAGLTFGYIVLTKMIFGYVLLIMLLFSLILVIFNRKNSNLKKSFIILIISFFSTSPYLFYTYNLTGRLFYWGDGSDTLYWMSTPYEGEYGDWKSDLSLHSIENGNFNIPGADSVLQAHHQNDYLKINKKTGLARDDEFKKLALKNIKENPKKYIENIIYNMGRLIFHYPFSHAIQRPKILLIFPINGILLTMILFCLIPTLLNWRKIPIYLKFLLIIAALYFGGSSLVSALIRMFTIIVPILLVWIAFVFEHTVKINFRILNIRSKTD